jgi:hypothetical protein
MRYFMWNPAIMSRHRACHGALRPGRSANANGGTAASRTAAAIFSAPIRRAWWLATALYSVDEPEDRNGIAHRGLPLAMPHVQLKFKRFRPRCSTAPRGQTR